MLGVTVSGPTLLGTAAGATAIDRVGLDGNPITLVLLLVGLAIVPILLMTCTSFLKFAVVLSILRTALGTQQLPPNMVVLGLAGVLSLYVMAPVGVDMADALEADLQERGVETPTTGHLLESVPRAIEPLREFLARHAHEDEIAVFFGLAEKRAALQQAALQQAALQQATVVEGAAPPETTASAHGTVRAATAPLHTDPFDEFVRSRGVAAPSRSTPSAPSAPTAAPLPVPHPADQSPLTEPGARDLMVLLPAFMISELTEAFAIGFLLFLPFLVIDLVVANILLAMGMHMLSPVIVSLPFKLLLFIMVDGWRLISEGLLQAYIV
ncbi:MAG: hypothetical protein AAGC60_01715 [Acidobacteriota bacterium]